MNCLSFSLGVYSVRAPRLLLESSSLTRVSRLPVPASELQGNSIWPTAPSHLIPTLKTKPTTTKTMLFVPERKVGEIMHTICTHWSALASICSRVAQSAPFLKKLIEAGVRCAWCLCVCVMCAQAGFVSDRQSPPTVSPSHPINSLEQLIGVILLDPKAGLFSKANSSFSALPLFGRAIGPHILQRGA